MMLDRSTIKRLASQVFAHEYRDNTAQLERVELFAHAIKQAVLIELAKQEPVAKVDASDDGYFAEILPDRDVKIGQLLYAAPQPNLAEGVEGSIRVFIKRPNNEWERVDTIEKSLNTNVGVPDGMVMVPREPSAAMLDSIKFMSQISDEAMAVRYKAMIAAAEKEQGK